MNKNESKYFNTAVRMDEALISLLEKKDFEYITIKEICEAAGVNRSTFYLRYENTSDLLKETTEYITNSFFSYFSKDTQNISQRFQNCDLKELMFITPEYLTPYVEEAHEPIIDKETFQLVQQRLDEMKRFNLGKISNAVYPFSGRLHCPHCGKNYRRKTTATGIVWICSTYNTKGKKYCPTAKQIPEEKLYAACCDALGISDFDEDIFQSEIQQIIVPAPNRLEFIFHNGTTKTVEWQDRSRSESWTAEKRKQAGQISKERRWHRCP